MVWSTALVASGSTGTGHSTGHIAATATSETTATSESRSAEARAVTGNMTWHVAVVAIHAGHTAVETEGRTIRLNVSNTLAVVALLG